jgi:hypothetical protein
MNVALQVITLIVLCMTIVGAGATWWKTAKSSGEERATMAEAVKRLQADVQEIKGTLGNGGISGMKDEIKKLAVHCAGHMSDHDARIKNLETKR